MKRITNINDPNNVIIVSDAYINGNRIVCITETDEFDLWRNCWKLEDFPELPDRLEEAAEKMARIAYPYKVGMKGLICENSIPIFKDGFIAGAEWMKAKMMEETVEGVAEELYNDGEPQCTVGVGTYFKPGEKVYVIKKEDEK